MTRLTRYHQEGLLVDEGGYYEPDKSNYMDITNKLGQLEDLMEQYNINDLVELKIALDYYEQTKKVEKITANAEIDTFKEIQDLLTKANTYDNLSNELGCPLDVVFKALKEGIYKKDENIIFEATLRIYKGEAYLCQPYDDRLLHKVLLKDYGKTWWLKGDKQ